MGRQKKQTKKQAGAAGQPRKPFAAKQAAQDSDAVLSRVKKLEKSGQFEAAADLLQSVFRAWPHHPEALCAMARILAAQKQVAEAATLMAQALEQGAGNAELLYSAGFVQYRAGNVSFAVESLLAALNVQPRHLESLLLLTNIFIEEKRWEDVLTFSLRLLEMLPENGDVLLAAGTAHLRLNNFREAHDFLSRAVQLDGQCTKKLLNLGTVCRFLRDYDQAVHWYTRVLERDPDNVETLNALSSLYVDRHLFDKARHCLDRSLALDPGNADSLAALAYFQVKLRKIEEAERTYQSLLRINPDHHEARFAYGSLLLLKGDFRRGLPYYESRFAVMGTFLDGPWPIWDGRSAAGKRLLVRAEQGAGDTIQFCRLLPLLKKLGAEIVFSCQPSLGRLMSSVPAIDTLLPVTEFPIDKVSVDAQVALMSLMGVLGITLDTLPGHCPYLAVAPERIEHARSRMVPSAKVKVALIWAGNPRQTDDHNRSMTLAQLAPLGELADEIDFYSLQVGPAQQQVAGDGGVLRLKDVSAELHDYADTAAFMACMDLVVSVCTSTVHLAGALALPTVALLPFAADWRWFTDRDDSPWYPTVRLLRQPGPGEWQPVIQTLHQVLRQTARR